MSNEVNAFVNSLLEAPPGNPNTVQLEIDVDGDVCAQFEVMLLIMTGILSRWYEPPITIGIVTDEDIARLVNYFASFGIKFHIESRPIPAVLRINNRDYIQQTRLEDMKFQVAHKDRLYSVRFSNLATA